MCEDIENIGEDIEDIGKDIEFKNIVCFIHVRLLVDIQLRSATVHSSVTQPEPASLGSVLPWMCEAALKSCVIGGSGLETLRSGRAP